MTSALAPGQQSLESGQNSVLLAVQGNERDQVLVMRNRKCTHRHMFIALLSCCQVQEELSSCLWEDFCYLSHWFLVTGSISLTRHFRRAMKGSVTTSTFSSVESFEYHEHNVWNPMLASLCHFEIGVWMEALLDEVGMGRISLACHFRWIYCATRHLPGQLSTITCQRGIGRLSSFNVLRRKVAI